MEAYDGFMKASLRVGVVGAGVFGNYHAAKVVAHERTVLSGLYDHNRERCDALASKHHTQAYPTLESLIEVSDALIVASPATQHAEACQKALSRGRHVLVEKPISPDRDQAEEIVSIANANNCVLQVGHQERIVAAAIGLNRVELRPKEVEIIRHAPRSHRNQDTSVVMDLMIHDLDLVHWLFGEPEWINTESATRIYSDHYDSVRAEMGYEDMVVRLSASRDAELQRSWTLRYAESTVTIDFGAKLLTHDTGFDLDPDFGDRADVKDSLATATDHFVSACLDGSEPLISGEEGLAAVGLAIKIERGGS